MAYFKEGSGSFSVAPVPSARLQLSRRPSNAGARPGAIFKQRRRSWLRWAWPRALAVSVLLFGVIAGFDLLVLHGNSFLLGFAVGASAALFLAALELQVPQRVENWRIGASAERRTGKCLASLEAQGWSVHHGVLADWGDRDHLVFGPNGLFLLETKHRSGRMAVQDGSLVTKYPFSGDDPEKREPLSAGCTTRAHELASQVARRTRRTTYQPWVHAVVVLWGDFPAGETTSNGVTFIHGQRLAGWLRNHRGPAVPEWLRSEVAESLSEIGKTGISGPRRASPSTA
jgi:hypothetical protein